MFGIRSLLSKACTVYVFDEQCVRASSRWWVVCCPLRPGPAWCCVTCQCCCGPSWLYGQDMRGDTWTGVWGAGGSWLVPGILHPECFSFSGTGFCSLESEKCIWSPRRACVGVTMEESWGHNSHQRRKREKADEVVVVVVGAVQVTWIFSGLIWEASTHPCTFLSLNMYCKVLIKQAPDWRGTKNKTFQFTWCVWKGVVGGYFIWLCTLSASCFG